MTCAGASSLAGNGAAIARAVVALTLTAAALTACPKHASIADEVDREPTVAVQSDRDVLVLGLAGDVSLRALAIEALVASEPIESALGFATAGRFSGEQEVQIVAMTALGGRMPDPAAEAFLRSVILEETSAVVRSYAALALVSKVPETQREWFRTLPGPWATSGGGVGVFVAAHRAGMAGVSSLLITLLQSGTLPAEPALVRALGVVPGVDWADVAARAEPEVVHHAWCAAALASFSGATGEAIRDARARDPDGVDDVVDAWADCPARSAVSVLRALPGEVAKLGVVGRRGAGVEAARRALEGEWWIDAIQALARRGEDGHAILREWAVNQDDLRREVVAMALVETALVGDTALVESFRTDASLRTRAAAAAIRAGRGAE